MNEEELKNKYTERAKIFQQAMESCKSSSPIDCIEWFADRIAELEKEVEKHKWNNVFLEDCADYDKKIAEEYTNLQERIERLEKENAELKADNEARKFAMAMSEKVEKQLRNERNTFLAQNEQYETDLIDFNENLIKAKEIIREFVKWANWQGNSKCPSFKSIQDKAEQFLSEVKK